MAAHKMPKRGAAGQQYAIIVGLIGVVALFGVSQMGSGVNQLMSRTGNTLTGVVNGTVGAAQPTVPPPPPDTTPDSFSFSATSNATASSTVNSAIILPVGYNSATAISISGTGSPMYRRCSDAACASPIGGYTSSAGTISPGQYVQLQLTASGTAGATVTASLTIGGVSANWAVTTASGAYLIITSTALANNLSSKIGAASSWTQCAVFPNGTPFDFVTLRNNCTGNQILQIDQVGAEFTGAYINSSFLSLQSNCTWTYPNGFYYTTAGGRAANTYDHNGSSTSSGQVRIEFCSSNSGRFHVNGYKDHGLTLSQVHYYSGNGSWQPGFNLATGSNVTVTGIVGDVYFYHK